ncbi:MAG: hypothetical protein R3222_08345, partial [Balneolaceae bacterium]|nr:hypothetical protein [Balneolaceae bacterium]
MPNTDNLTNTFRFPYAKYPAVRVILLLAGGILLSDHVGIGSGLWAFLLASTLLLLVLNIFLLMPRFSFQLYHFTVFCYLASIFLFGAWRYTHQTEKAETYISKFLNTLTWEKVSFKGKVYDIRRSSSGSYQLDVLIDT